MLIACPRCGRLLHYIGERHFANGGRAFEVCPATIPRERDIHPALARAVAERDGVTLAVPVWAAQEVSVA